MQRNKRDPLRHGRPVRLVGRFPIAALCAALLLLSGCSRAEPVQPPATSPNELQPFDGQPRAHVMTAAPLRIDPGPDATALFQRVIECYPAPSWFRPEVSAELRSAQRNVVGDYGASGSGAALVVRVPLWSSQEAEKEREREASRRLKVSAAVGVFVEALVQFRLTERELELWQGIEARSKARVAAGVAETAEQIEALKKVAEIERRRVAELSKIVTARLELVGLCAADKADGVNQYLMRFNPLEPGQKLARGGS